MSEEENKIDLENIIDKQFQKMTVLQETTLLLQCTCYLSQLCVLSCTILMQF